MSAERSQWHFGVLSFTGTGHLNALISLSQELRDRGHKVTFFEKPKIEDRVRQAGFEFVPIGALHASKQIKRSTSHSNVWSEFSTLRFNLKRIIQDMETFLAENPVALKEAHVDALLINEIALTGPTVAQMLHLPYFIISTSVPHNFGWRGISWFTGYRHSTSCISWMQSVFLELSILRMRGPIRWALTRYRRRAGLGRIRGILPSSSCLAHITQLPQCLELPRRSVPDKFHYTGPFVHKAARPRPDFPWNRLDGRPIIYASLGTTRNVQPAAFYQIAEACLDLDAQLVISLGGRFDPSDFLDLPGQPLVTRYAPQLDLLKLAQVVITHGGPNTVFEALMEGKPMIAIPIAYDQPAIAARLARLHIAEVLPIMRLSAKRIRAAVTKLLSDTSYQEAAGKMQSTLQSIRGSARAADIIEEALNQYAGSQRIEKPVEWSSQPYDRVASGSQAVSYLPR